MLESASSLADGDTTEQPAAPAEEAQTEGGQPPAEGEQATEGDAPKIPEGYVKIPGENASEEELAAWRAARGVPDDVSGYELDKIELPEGAEFDQARADAMAPIMHKLGLPASDVKALVEADAAYRAQENAAAQQEFESNLNTGREKLDEKWTAAGESISENESLGKAAWKAFGDPEFADSMKEHNIDRLASTYSFAVNAGKGMQAALDMMAQEGVDGSKIQAFADKYKFKIPDAKYVSGDSAKGSPSRLADRLLGGLMGDRS